MENKIHKDNLVLETIKIKPCQIIICLVPLAAFMVYVMLSYLYGGNNAAILCILLFAILVIKAYLSLKKDPDLAESASTTFHRKKPHLP